MNQNSNNIVNTYLKEIKRKAPAAYCAQLMDELESSVECYVEQNSVNRIEVLYQIFGTPDDYVNGFISSLDSPSYSPSVPPSPMLSSSAFFPLVPSFLVD